MPTRDLQDEFRTSGTIKVKNADGILVPFHPRTKTDCIHNYQSGKNLTEIIEKLESDIEDAANSGGVKVTYSEVTEESAVQYSNESMVVKIEWPEVPEDVWQFTVDTTVYAYNGHPNEQNVRTGIPFNLYGMQGITLNVDWGDGTASTLTSADYTEHNSTASEHSYEEPGQYTIQIRSSDWSSTYFSVLGAHGWWDNSPDLNAKFDATVCFRETVVCIDSPLPAIKGMKYWKSTNGSRTTSPNSVQYLFFTSNLRRICPTFFHNCTNLEIFDNLFAGSTSLQEIPEDLFKYCTNAVSFVDCFSSGYGIKSIPENLFKYCTNAVSFNGCFNFCSAVTSVAENLFRYNTLATDFSECFDNSGLTSIPENLFKYNTLATDFSDCFHGTRIKSIPENLFRYNTAATNFYHCFACDSLESIPENLFRYNTAVTSFSFCFSGRNLTSIPENLFKYNTAVTTFSYCFSWCQNLTSIPENLFKYNTAVTAFNNCFGNCSKLKNFKLHIGSSLVTSCSEFIPVISGSTRTVYVPSGSTTETTFSEAASNFSITVIGE